MAVSTTYSLNLVDTLDPTSITSSSDAASLSNGGVAVVGDHVGHTDLTIFEPNGDIAGNNLVITGTPAAVTQISNGNIVVLADTGTDMAFTIVDGTGATVRNATSIAQSGPDVLDPEVAGLTGGGFVVAFQDFFGGTDNDIGLKFYNNAGDFVRNVTVDASGANDQNPSVVGLADGGVAVAWHRNIGSGNELRYAVYEANGDVRLAPTLLDNTGTLNRNASVVALDNGGFAIAYEDNAGGDLDISLARFNAAGTLVDFDDISQTAANETNAYATVLSNGMILVGSTNNQFSDTDPTFTLIDQNTGAILATTSTGFTFQDDDDISVAAMTNGQFATFLTSNGDVIGQILQARRSSTGDASADNIVGDDLIDFVDGGGGGDSIRGGLGADSLFGNTGNDRFEISGAESTGDTIDGGSDVDTIVVRDDVSADTRLDLTTISGIEEIEFSASNTLTTSVTIQAIQVGAAIPSNLLIDGNFTGVQDKFRVEMGTDTSVNLSGFTFQDFFPENSGELDRFIVLGDNDAESILGTSIRDELFGSGGDDSLGGGGGGDLLSGGLGSDTASYSQATAGVTASLFNAAINTGEAAGDSYNSIENLIGSTFGDTLEGTAGINQIRGGGGEDVIRGLNGADNLSGGDSNDTLNGGEGRDVLAGGTGSDLATYQNATARVIASLANSAINTGEAAGDTYNSIERLTGSNFDDALNGANVVNNTLRGAGGDDTLKGGTGNDALEGGADDDTFVFNTALNATTNVDRILDFNHVDDSIQLDQTIFTQITVTGPLLSGFFKNISAAPVDTNDRILYNSGTGEIFYDANGSGAGQRTLFATVNPGTLVNATDFFVTT